MAKRLMWIMTVEEVGGIMMEMIVMKTKKKKREKR